MEYVLDGEHKDLPFLEVRPRGMVLEPCVEGVLLYLEENQWFYEINSKCPKPGSQQILSSR